MTRHICDRQEESQMMSHLLRCRILKQKCTLITININKAFNTVPRHTPVQNILTTTWTTTNFGSQTLSLAHKHMLHSTTPFHLPKPSKMVSHSNLFFLQHFLTFSSMTSQNPHCMWQSLPIQMTFPQQTRPQMQPDTYFNNMKQFHHWLIQNRILSTRSTIHSNSGQTWI